jgi:hypothetical protein
MNARLLPYVAVVLGVWLFTDDLQGLARLNGYGLLGGVARTFADLLLLYFGGQALKKQARAHAQ